MGLPAFIYLLMTFLVATFTPDRDPSVLYISIACSYLPTISGDLPIYDFGSGWGTNSLEAARRGAKVVAGDLHLMWMAYCFLLL